MTKIKQNSAENYFALF